MKMYHPGVKHRLQARLEMRQHARGYTVYRGTKPAYKRVPKDEALAEAIIALLMIVAITTLMLSM